MHYYNASMYKMQRPMAAIVKDLRNHYDASGMSQSAYSKAAGVHQSTVSRMLSPKYQPKRLSRGLTRLCNYASVEIFSHGHVDPRNSKELMDALEYVWDGSTQHSKALARVIRELGHLKSFNTE